MWLKKRKIEEGAPGISKAVASSTAYRRRSIVDTDGAECGEVSGRVFSTKDEMNSTTMQIINATRAPMLWPIAIVDSIEVEESRQRKGLGTAALITFVSELHAEGVKLILLRVGNFDANDQDGRDYACWLARWYEKRGFKSIVADGVRLAVENPMLGVKRPEMLWMFTLQLFR
jgi:GNAT superfamily N-acetyltransferase